MKRERLTLLLLLVCVLHALTYPARGEATCQISCTGLACVCTGTGTCSLTTGTSVNPGSVIDCSGRDIQVMGSSGYIRVIDGYLTLRARTVTVSGQRSIRAERSSSTSTAPYGLTMKLSGDLFLSGYLSARSNTGGGEITVEAAGSITISDDGANTTGIDAGGTAPNAAGGWVRLHAGGTVEIDDPIRADTPSASVGVARGGEVEIEAGRDIYVNQEINVFGRQDSAGTISLTAHGDTDSVGLPLDPKPPCTNASYPGWIDINSRLLAEGGNTDSTGGQIALTGRKISVDAELSAQGGVAAAGGLSSGGMVSLDAECSIAINSTIDVTSGGGGPGLGEGSMSAECDGDISIASAVSILTRSDANGGDGGSVALRAQGSLSLGTNASIDARGNTSSGNQGSGAEIDLEGCDVTLSSGVVLNGSGFNGGQVTLTGHGHLVASTGATVNASGTVGSGGANGIVTMVYREEGWCSNDAARQCAPPACLMQSSGVCSNSPTTHCTSNASCAGGTCLLGVCNTSVGTRCNDATPCPQGCSSPGTCVPNPTEGATMQPAPFHVSSLNLSRCH